MLIDASEFNKIQIPTSAPTKSAVFDDGHLRSDPQTIQEFLDGYSSIMRQSRTPEVEGEPEKTALVKFFDSVWGCVVEVP